MTERLAGTAPSDCHPFVIQGVSNGALNPLPRWRSLRCRRSWSETGSQGSARASPPWRFKSGVRSGNIGGRGDVSVSDLRKVGGGLQAALGRQPQLSIDRVWGWDQADPGIHRDVRRIRQTPHQRRTLRGGPHAVSDDHRRRRAGREPYRRKAGRSRAGRSHARQHLSRRNHEVGRRSNQRPQPGIGAAEFRDRDRAPFRRLRHQLPVHHVPRERQSGRSRKKSVRTRRSSGRAASAARATKASPA